MKPKNFIALIIFALALVGCKFEDPQSQEEILVSKVLKSQQSIYQASSNKNSLLSKEIYQASHYYHDSHSQEDIRSLQLQVGNLSFTGYGHNHFSLTDVTLDYDLDTITQDYLYEYAGYIYDYEERYYFQTARPFVGNAHQNPHKGIMRFSGNYQDITVSVIDKAHVDIRIYDHYESYHDRTIHTTWQALGF